MYIKTEGVGQLPVCSLLLGVSEDVRLEVCRLCELLIAAVKGTHVRYVLLAEIFGDGRGESGFAVVDVADGADWIGRGVPLQWVLDRSNLAKG